MMMHGSAGTSMVQGLGNERNRFFEDLQRKTKSIELKLTSLVQEYDKSSHPPPRVFLAKVEELMGEYSRLLEEITARKSPPFCGSLSTRTVPTRPLSTSLTVSTQASTKTLKPTNSSMFLIRFKNTTIHLFHY